MAKIKELTSKQLGRHSENVFLFAGRHQSCIRLAYHSLSMDPNEPRALRSLSDVLCGDSNGSSGLEQWSAIILEYALRPSSPIPLDIHKELDDHLFRAKWSWAFVLKRDGATVASWEELNDRSLFVVDEQRYCDFLARIIDRCGSLEESFLVAHTISGFMGKLLMHKTLGRHVSDEEMFQTDQFIPAPEYADWLESDTAELDALENRREHPAM